MSNSRARTPLRPANWRSAKHVSSPPDQGPRSANCVTLTRRTGRYDAAMSTANLQSLGYEIDTDFRRSLLSSIALFRGVGPDALTDLLPQCARFDVTAGEVLLSPQRPNRCVYVVL